MIRVLGIDPGSRRAGYACIDCGLNGAQYVDHGTIPLSGGMGDRLMRLDRAMTELIEELKPQELSLEKVFLAKNPQSALVLGYSRGVILLAAARAKLPVFEYSATQIKKGVTGYGKADKAQIQKMLELMLGRMHFSSHDSSDALAIALCHARSVPNSTSLNV